MTGTRQPPDDFDGAGLFSQLPDDPGSLVAVLAARLQRSPPGILEIAQGAGNADDPETIVWIFEALTGRSTTAAERLKLRTQIEARQRPPW